MSVNIFGSSGSAAWKSNDEYVDQKFITLTNNLVTKVNKSGDVLTGPLSLGDNTITSSYIAVNDDDLVNKKYIDTLTASAGDMSLNSKLNKSGGVMTGNLDMGPNNLSSNYLAIVASDIPNKQYIDIGLSQKLGDDDLRHIENKLSLKLNKSDIRYVKNKVGYIPDLDKNIGKNGFITNASSEAPPIGRTTFDSHNAFNCWKGHWKAIDKNNAWIKIKCPEMIMIHKIALRGLDSSFTRIVRWKLEASNDDINWTILYELLPIRLTPGIIVMATDGVLSNEVKYLNISNKESFNFLK